MPRAKTSSAAIQDRDTEPDWLAEAQHIAELYQPPATGRPSTITDVHRVNQLLKLVARGNYVGTAFLAAGFSRQHKANWEHDAKDGNIAAIALFDAIERAERLAESQIVDNVRRASELPQFWAAGMTLLERRHPDRFGKRTEDSSGPRVVVQIGVRDGDVQVKLGESGAGQHTITGSESPVGLLDSQ